MPAALKAAGRPGRAETQESGMSQQNVLVAQGPGNRLPNGGKGTAQGHPCRGGR